MATVKALLDTRYKSVGDLYSIVIRVSSLSKYKNYPVGYRVKLNQFKDGYAKAHRDAHVINQTIDDMLGVVRDYFKACRLKDVEPDVTKAFSGQSSSFAQYIHSRALEYKTRDQFTQYRKTLYLAQAVKKVLGEATFDQIGTKEVRNLDTYFIGQGNGANTRNKKKQSLSGLFKEARKEELHTRENPFEEISIKPEPTKKEKLTPEELKSLEDVELVGDQAMARDLFLMSYYMKGNRFETCLTIKPEQIHGGRIHLRMNKGLKYQSIALHDKLKAIVDRYKKKDQMFIFPYLTEPFKDSEDKRKRLDVLNVTVNSNLKMAAALAGIKKNVTFHMARHTLAYHLKHTTDSIHVIRDVLGHTDTRITELYLADLDDQHLDKELEKVYKR